MHMNHLNMFFQYSKGVLNWFETTQCNFSLKFHSFAIKTCVLDNNIKSQCIVLSYGYLKCLNIISPHDKC